MHGLAPIVAPGDSLNLNITGLGIPTLTLGTAAERTVVVRHFRRLGHLRRHRERDDTPPAAVYNLVLDMGVAGYQNGVADTIDASLDPATGQFVLSGQRHGRKIPRRARARSIR